MKTIAKDVEKRAPLYTVGNVIDPATMENGSFSIWKFLKN